MRCMRWFEQVQDFFETAGSLQFMVLATCISPCLGNCEISTRDSYCLLSGEPQFGCHEQVTVVHVTLAHGIVF